MPRGARRGAVAVRHIRCGVVHLVADVYRQVHGVGQRRLAVLEAQDEGALGLDEGGRGEGDRQLLPQVVGAAARPLQVRGAAHRGVGSGREDLPRGAVVVEEAEVGGHGAVPFLVVQEYVIGADIRNSRPVVEADDEVHTAIRSDVESALDGVRGLAVRHIHLELLEAVGVHDVGEVLGDTVLAAVVAPGDLAIQRIQGTEVVAERGGAVVDVLGPGLDHQALVLRDVARLHLDREEEGRDVAEVGHRGDVGLQVHHVQLHLGGLAVLPHLALPVAVVHLGAVFIISVQCDVGQARIQVLDGRAELVVLVEGEIEREQLAVRLHDLEVQGGQVLDVVPAHRRDEGGGAGEGSAEPAHAVVSF